MINKTVPSILIIMILSFCNQSNQPASYLDQTLPVDQRVDILLEQLTIEEKVGQMSQYVGINLMEEIEEGRRSSQNLSDEDIEQSDEFAFYPGYGREDIEDLVKKGFIGSFLHVSDIEEANHLQRLAAMSTHRIPLLMGIDASHGHTFFQPAGTVYPTLIGLASSWNPELVEEIGLATAEEMRVTGYHWTFSANFSVSRDARWGRVGETFGEDPLLAGLLGSALIRGYQGTTESLTDHVLGCANHYIASGEPDNGLNFSPMDVSERRLRELYLPPFKAAVDAGVETIMLAHNEVNGVPCHSNTYLIEEILRGELGFKGFIVSDWMDVERLNTLHGIAESKKEACKLAIEAGLDMNMHGPEFFEDVIELVNEGQISETRIDQSVRRILKAKFKLGLFENTIVDDDNVNDIVLNEKHKALALKAARQSVVLLKNDNNFLPLNFNPKRIFITGPNANNHTILGDWTKPQPAENVTTVLEGLIDIIPDDIILDFYDCGEIWELNEHDIEMAVQKAKEADVVILVVGENSLRENGNNRTCGENVARDNIDLPGMQSELIDNIQQTGIPNIIVLINGRPNASPWMTTDIPAIIESWEPGMYGGQAIAEVIFGRYNPGGKLPITIPRNAGQILSVYNHRPSSNFRSYANNETGPLFPFGFGLSYTTFEYADLRIPDVVERDEEVIASCTVTNTGEIAGDEIVMVFLTDLISSVTTPVKKLVSFERISLTPGESKNVEFTITKDDMSLWDENMKKIVEPGAFELTIGLDKLKGKFEVKNKSL